MTSDINKLFSTDPMELTSEDIDAIIEEMRSRRHLFNSAPVTRSGAPKKLTKAEEKVKGISLDISL